MTGSGTPSMGKKNKLKKGRCASCGFGKSAKRRSYNWQTKAGE
jgi:large subunit ribosomal protein L37e